MKGWQLGALVVAFIAVLGVFAYLFQPSGQGGPVIVTEDATTGKLRPVPTPTPSNEPDKSIKGNTSTFSGRDSEGKISWTLKATSILMRDAEKKADAKDIECTFFSKEGQPMVIVTSRGCTINLANNNLQFLGRVTAVDPAGQRLTVEHLRYDGTQKRFYGHGGVRMTRATSVLVGDKVWADPKMSMVQLDGHVQAYVRTLAIATPAPVAPPTIPPPPKEEKIDEPVAAPSPAAPSTTGASPARAPRRAGVVPAEPAPQTPPPQGQRLPAEPVASSR